MFYTPRIAYKLSDNFGRSRARGHSLCGVEEDIPALNLWLAQLLAESPSRMHILSKTTLCTGTA